MKHINPVLVFLLFCLLVYSCQQPSSRDKAHELYLKGRQILLYDRTEVAAGENYYAKAAEYFEQAIAIDPTYAPAHANLAYPSAVKNINIKKMPQDEAGIIARQTAEKAIALDPNLSDGYVALGIIQMVYENDPKGSEKSLKRAIELDAQNSEAHKEYGLLLRRYFGRFKDALNEVKQASELDPESIDAQYELAMTYRFNNQYDKALEFSQKALNGDPNRIVYYVEVAHDYIMSGEYDEALAVAQKGLNVNPDNLSLNGYRGWSYIKKGMYKEALAAYEKAKNRAGIGWVYALMGKRNEAMKIINELTKLREEGARNAWSISWVYMNLSEKEKAMDWLEKSYEENQNRSGFGNWKWQLSAYDDYDVLRSEPRFQALLKK